MTDNNHTIRPPHELVQQWFDDAKASPAGQWVTDVATQAARWGYEQRGAVNEAELQKARDEELEACCEVLENDLCCFVADDLRAARRPKPSLKELNLQHLEVMERDGHYLPEIISDLRRAIESLLD